VHLHDLALRTENLAGRFDTAAQIARPRAALPNSIAVHPGGLDEHDELTGLAQGEQAAVHALALARLLTALPRKHDPLAGTESAVAFLGPLGAGALDADRFTAWRKVALPAPDRGKADRPPCAALPPLLHAGEAALGWMESGATDQPDAIVALAITALLLARSETLQMIPLPFWAAWPALGHPQEEGLPRLRPALARELAGADRAPWAVVFLSLAAEAARACLRELDRLQEAAQAGKKSGRRSISARVHDPLEHALAAAGGGGTGPGLAGGHPAGARGQVGDHGAGGEPDPRDVGEGRGGAGGDGEGEFSRVRRVIEEARLDGRDGSGLLASTQRRQSNRSRHVVMAAGQRSVPFSGDVRRQ